VGHSVRLRIADDSRGSVYAKSTRAGLVDTSSAEWIVEAPSVCSSSTISSSNCQTVPLADFGTTHFSSASATTTTGHTGTISDPGWSTTAIILSRGGRSFGGDQAPTNNPSGQATPAALSLTGTAFDVSYQSAGGRA
jgi:Peptidase A4 family